MSSVFEDDVLCLALHPSEYQVVIGLVSGHVHALSYVYSAGDLELTTLWATKRHKKACRSVAYSPDGTSILSVGADKVIKRASSASGKVLQKFTAAHEDTINCVTWANSDVFCTGDDSGTIKGWSVTQNSGSKSQRTFQTHEDYIADLIALEGKFILATSGDGTVSIHDLRSNTSGKPKRSDDQEDDLTCALLMKTAKKGGKVVVGGSSGVISIFDRSDIGDMNDRILPPRPTVVKKKGRKGLSKTMGEDVISVESMAKIDDDTMVVGGSDGVVRLLRILPNKWDRELIRFGTEEPVVSVQVNHEKLVFAASGTTLKVVSLLETPSESVPEKDDKSDGDEFSTSSEDDNETSQAEEENSDSESPAPPPSKKPKKSAQTTASKPKDTFYDDL